MNQNITHKTCSVCSVSKLLSDFYTRKNRKSKHLSRCIKCYEIYNPSLKQIKRDSKIDMVNFLGGECIKCGYKNPEAIAFHHLYPSEKKFNIAGRSSIRKPLKNEAIVKELRKCVLLCMNCHAEFHFGRFDLGPLLDKLPKFNENTEKQDSIRDDSLLGLQISFVD